MNNTYFEVIVEDGLQIEQFPTFAGMNIFVTECQNLGLDYEIFELPCLVD